MPALVTTASSLVITVLVTSGSLADREHRKWSQPDVVMAHNPYTQENAVRRKISKTLFSTNARFS